VSRRCQNPRVRVARPLVHGSRSMTSVSRLRFVLPLALLFGLSGCGEFAKQADKEFGDQHFKSAIALIELHKVRFGVYPEQLSELRFSGAWDATTISCVKYKKVEDGYELDLVRGLGRDSRAFLPAGILAWARSAKDQHRRVRRKTSGWS
jgi:hypothetical protein